MQDNPRGLSTEADLEANRVLIDALWDSRTEGSFCAADGVNIRYVEVPCPSSTRPPIVVSPGRTEFIDKYTEVVFDLHNQGYTVWLIDHRGQGGSDRLLPDSHMGHVSEGRALAHCAGSFDGRCHRCTLCTATPRRPAGRSALFADAGYPCGSTACTGVAIGVAKLVQAIVDRRANKAHAYVLGGTGYEEVPFTKGKKANALTSCEQRLDYLNQQYEENPEWQLGSPTNWWLLEAYAAMEAIEADVAALKVPVEILVSGADRIVSNKGVAKFVKASAELPSAKVHAEYFADAEHELLLEVDEIRLPAMNHLLDFMESVQEQ